MDTSTDAGRPPADFGTEFRRSSVSLYMQTQTVFPGPEALPSPRAALDDPLLLIDPICRAAARRKLHLFARLPAVGIDDLVQAARLRAMHAHATYRPPHNYSSWIWRAAAAAILDLYKTTSREYARAHTYGARAVEHQYPGSPFAQPASPIEGVAEMKINLPKKLSSYKCGRIGHPPAAYVAALAYRYQSGIGWRTLAAKLKADAAFLSLCGFKSAPAVRRLRDSAARLAKWAKSPAPASK
jgi:hypothetical protein